MPVVLLRWLWRGIILPAVSDSNCYPPVAAVAVFLQQSGGALVRAQVTSLLLVTILGASSLEKAP